MTAPATSRVTDTASTVTHAPVLGTASRIIATRETPVRVALRSLLVVVLFWWLATGTIFSLERSATTRELGLWLATLLAAGGAWVVYRERAVATPAAVRRAFLGAAFVWTWVQVAFYGGWLIGPETLRFAVPAQGPSWSHATAAVASMLWYQLAMLGVIALVAWIVRGAPNRIGLWALALFWTEHQIASINIFFGVENPGRGFFPDSLVFLESYFGPQRSTVLLPLSLAAVLAYTVYVAVQAVRSASPARRQAMMLLAVLGALGVFELAVLGTPMPTILWDWALGVRGY